MVLLLAFVAYGLVLSIALAHGNPRHGRGVGSYLLTRSVSRADVADFMLDQLTSGQYLRAAPGICR